MKFLKRAPLIGYLTICFLFLLSTSASAYIDPSSTTFIIQAVAGVAIVVGTAVAVFWRRAKKKVLHKLGIQENANKTVEDDNIGVDDSQEPPVAP